MTELADTSVLILARRDPSIGRLMEGPIRLGEIATCDVVELEYLMGARNATDYDAIVEALGGFKRLATEPADWARAREVHRALAAHGPRLPALGPDPGSADRRGRRASWSRACFTTTRTTTGSRASRASRPAGSCLADQRPESEQMAGSAMRPRFDSGSERFLEALRVAATLHAGKARKKTDMPDVGHLLGTCSIAMEFGANEDQAIAALLHDIIEDVEPVEKARAAVDAFGPEVLRIVEACTDSDTLPKPPWRERKEAYLAHLPECRRARSSSSPRPTSSTTRARS